MRADVIDEDCGQWLGAEVLRAAPELVVHLRTQQRVARGRYTAAVQDGTHPLEQILSQSAALDLRARVNVDGPEGTPEATHTVVDYGFHAAHGQLAEERTCLSRKLSHARFTWNVQSSTGIPPPKAILSYRAHVVGCPDRCRYHMDITLVDFKRQHQNAGRSRSRSHRTALCSAASSSVTKHDGRQAGHTLCAAVMKSPMQCASVCASSRAEMMKAIGRALP